MADISVGRAFWKDLVRQIALRTRNSADAEDLLHAAYLRLARYQAQRPVDNVGAFLVRTALNLNIDNCRHSNIHRNVAPSPQLQDTAPLQDEVMASRDRLIRLRAGLDQLPQRTREIFLMHRLDKLTYNDIADRLGLSTSAAEKHVAKAASFLTKWIEGW